MAGQKPVAKIKAGQVSVALWDNEITVNGRTVTVLKATIQRRYKDKNGTWQTSGSFNRNEIPLAIYCLQKAFEKMVATDADETDSNGSDEEIPIQLWLALFFEAALEL